jgi:DNA polymerase-4
MEIPIEKQLNHNEPHLMHVDLNSCFATIEQQANPLLRGKPVAIVPFMSRGACIIAPSIEAKKLGIKTGFSLRDAKVICPDIIAKVADPRKYRDVHMKYKKIFLDYSPNVYAKSIDEVVVDFSGTRGLYKQKTLVQIAKEIKQRMREDIGEWISCSAGISTNQFLAKLAASLKKPDGLEVITHENLLDVYAS